MQTDHLHATCMISIDVLAQCSRRKSIVEQSSLVVIDQITYSCWEPSYRTSPNYTFHPHVKQIHSSYLKSSLNIESRQLMSCVGLTPDRETLALFQIVHSTLADIVDGVEIDLAAVSVPEPPVVIEMVCVRSECLSRLWQF